MIAVTDAELRRRVAALIERKRKEKWFDFKTGRMLFNHLYLKAKRMIEIEGMH